MAFGEIDRDLGSIRLAAWGRVVAASGPVPYLVVDGEGRPVEPIRWFLRDFAARGHPAGSIRSYAYDLHRWWRFLRVAGVEWDKVSSAVVRDFVLWMQQAAKSRPARRTGSLARAGQVNPITGKRHLGDGYQARTIRHSNAVLRCFYGFWIEQGQGPLVNPVPQERVRARGAAVGQAPPRRRRGDGPPERQALNYDALRAVLRRVNEPLGTNWTMHDMRHTCALRMVRSQTLSLRDVQTILGHAHLTTTQLYLIADDHEVHQRVRAWLASRGHRPQPPR